MERINDVMDKTRIYGEKVSIDEKSIVEFYNRRAGGGNGAVLLGNQNTAVLDAKAQYDKEYIMPMLGVNDKTRVLDLGCGIARWAEYLMPCCKFYCGVDVSEKMIAVAEATCRRMGTHYRLHTMGIADAVGKSSDFWSGPFALIIISGVFTYLNDDTLEQVLRRLPNHLAEHCTLYFTDPVGLGARLTLDHYASDALADSYSAIYRTAEEYLKFFLPLQAHGFSVVKSERKPDFDKAYTDTGRHFFILRR